MYILTAMETKCYHGYMNMYILTAMEAKYYHGYMYMYIFNVQHQTKIYVLLCSRGFQLFMLLLTVLLYSTLDRVEKDIFNGVLTRRRGLVAS